jgi:ribosomal protein L5
MFKNYYENIILYDFLLKSKVKNIFQFIKIKKICLNIGFKNVFLDKNNLINIILFLKIISNQKIKITKSKKNILFLKIKKNTIVGCKTTLRKKNLYFFLEKLIIFILPEINNINLNLEKNRINFKIVNILDFLEFKKEFFNFQNIPQIDVSIHINKNNSKILYLFLNYFFIKNKQK